MTHIRFLLLLGAITLPFTLAANGMTPARADDEHPPIRGGSFDYCMDFEQSYDDNGLFYRIHNDCDRDMNVHYRGNDNPQRVYGANIVRAGERSSKMRPGEALEFATCPRGYIPKGADRKVWRGGLYECRY